LISIILAGAIYLPYLHLFFRPAESELTDHKTVSPLAQKIARYQLNLWSQPGLLQSQLSAMRQANAEWDFMGRSFLTWSLANMALRHPEQKAELLEVIDRIIDQTLDLERDHGMEFFLMPYARARPFIQKPARSQFIDGEIALMLALRCLVEQQPFYLDQLSERVRLIVERMERSPTLSAESYPDECWTFCNTIALAAVRINDYLSGTNHSDFIRRWIALARSKLIDPRTGLLISAYSLDGQPIQEPEGSSIWMVTHCLALLDESFAVEQYQLAKKQLIRSCLGFGYAREWPEGFGSLMEMDIDSGIVVPGLGASPSSTGLAFIAASTFNDTEVLSSLLGSLECFGFATQSNGQLQYTAINQVGEAVILYALVQGPAWDIVKAGTK